MNGGATSGDIAAVILLSSALVLPVARAGAVCLDETPPIFVITDDDYYDNFTYNLVDGEYHNDDTVVISGSVRDDIMDEDKFGSKVLIEVYDPNSTLIFSNYAPLDANNGTFVYNYHLWLEDDWDSEESTRRNEYTVKATYGKHQADFTFILSRSIPSLSLLDVTIPRIMDVNRHNASKSEIQVGEQVQISTLVESNDRRDLEGTSFVVFFSIVDSTDVTVYIALQSGLLKGGCSTEAGFSWMTDQTGNYTIKTFAISSWLNPSVVSGSVQTAQIVVN
jgi:hypothetical protein